MISFTVNGKAHRLDVEPETPLLWVLRDELGLTGHQIWLRHRAMRRLHRACRRPGRALLSAAGRRRRGTKITTIEGLSPDSSHPVQQAWIAEDVPQCGYCQSGQIMAAVALLKEHPKPTDADIDANSPISAAAAPMRASAARSIAPPR